MRLHAPKAWLAPASVAADTTWVNDASARMDAVLTPCPDVTSEIPASLLACVQHGHTGNLWRDAISSHQALLDALDVLVKHSSWRDSIVALLMWPVLRSLRILGASWLWLWARQGLRLRCVCMCMCVWSSSSERGVQHSLVNFYRVTCSMRVQCTGSLCASHAAWASWLQKAASAVDTSRNSWEDCSHSRLRVSAVPRHRVQVSAASKLVPVAHAAEIRPSSRGNLLRQLLSANVDADLYGKELVRAVINVSLGEVVRLPCGLGLLPPALTAPPASSRCALQPPRVLQEPRCSSTL